MDDHDEFAGDALRDPVAREAYRQAAYDRGHAAGERAGYERARTEIAQAVFDEAQRLRADDFPAGRVGIEYVNGWENAGAWIEAELGQPSDSEILLDRASGLVSEANKIRMGEIDG